MTNLLRKLAIIGTLGLAACGKGNTHTPSPPTPGYDLSGSGFRYPSLDTIGYDRVKPAMLEEDTAAVRKMRDSVAKAERADSIREARFEREDALRRKKLNDHFAREDSIWENGCVPYTILTFKDENGQVQTLNNLNIITKAPDYIVFMKLDGRNKYTRSGSYDFIEGCKQDILGTRNQPWRKNDK